MGSDSDLSVLQPAADAQIISVDGKKIGATRVNFKKKLADDSRAKNANLGKTKPAA